MAATTRRARNYKERSSGFTFGHFALPIAAIAALGLLFIGVKLFFLTPPERVGRETARITPPIEQETQKTAEVPDFELVPPAVTDNPFANAEPERLETTDVSIVLAGPLTQTGTPVRSAQTSASAGGARNTQVSTRPARTSAPPAQVPSNPNAKWGVQIGAFVNADSASNLMSEIKRQGYSASISKVDSSGKTFHRVRVGAGNTRESADKLASELEKRGYPVAVVQML
ncbi:MAG: SPOR domain-containing protein [Synergistaceae bacterium]|jgi:cell division septation protein DedD|nr:SPOR domain-containing protein [Synergistaceae bacterium]